MQPKHIQISRSELVKRYLLAKETVVRLGYGDEIDWQERLQLAKITAVDFFREAAWVILSSGMKESVIRNKFPHVSVAFCCWDYKSVARDKASCIRRARRIFGHEAKVRAIAEVATRLTTLGFDEILRKLDEDGIVYLQTFPFLGPATSLHLAKNLGYDVVKPDRHLLRVATVLDFSSPTALCRFISESVGDRLAVVDVVIWRYATLEPRYLEHFTGKTRRIRRAA